MFGLVLRRALPRVTVAPTGLPKSHVQIKQLCTVTLNSLNPKEDKIEEEVSWKELDLSNSSTSNSSSNNSLADKSTSFRMKYDRDEFGRFYATGRRKTSSARVWIREGSGEVTVNGRRFVDYFQPLQRVEIVEAMSSASVGGLVDIWCTVSGGGISGQAGAVRLGLSRALQVANKNLRPTLKAAGMLERDSRIVERKKPGQKKARKKFQWVKR